MFNTPSFSTFVASLLFCLGIGVLAGAGSQARAAENGENTPGSPSWAAPRFRICTITKTRPPEPKCGA